MSTTGLQVFTDVMALTDKLDDSGNAVNTNTTKYQNRAVAIINMLLPSLYLYSDGAQQTVGKHTTPIRITSLSNTLPIDDAMATVLKFGLAGHLLARDDAAESNLWLQRYGEELMRLKNYQTESEAIVDYYGISNLTDY